MKTAAIICEYNPFHLGHARQLAWLRMQLGADTRIVCLMSGNFVQRGEPACFDKFVRARAAVACGADLVLELPVTLALQSAEGFAGSVALLERLGCVDVLCFGSECGTLEPLQAVADCMDTAEYTARLRKELEHGQSYPAAREAALCQLTGDGTVLQQPNNILAVEYLRALRRSGSTIQPMTLQREGSYHALQAEGEYASAAAVRSAMAKGGEWQALLPAAAASVFRSAPQYGIAYGERAMLARLRALTDAEWAAIPYGGEGLQYRLRDACRRETGYMDILRTAKTKRYPWTRLARMLLLAYLGLTEADLHREIPYLRVLAFTDAGRGVLRDCSTVLPIVNAGTNVPDRDYFQMECRCASLFTLFAADPNHMDCRMEQKGRIYYQKEKKTCFSQNTVIK